MTEARVPEFVYSSRWVDLVKLRGWEPTDADVRNFLREAEYRDQELENFLSATATAGGGEVTFSKGVLLLGESDGRWPMPSGITSLTNARVSLIAAGSTSTTIDVLVDAVSEATITVTSSTTEMTQALSVPCSGAVVSLDITAVGTGARGLVVVLEYA